MGPGNAYVPTDTNIRDNQHARMYRVTVKNKKPDPILDISKYTANQLVQVLGHSNMLYRLHAQRMLHHMGHNVQIESVLESILKTRRWPDKTGLDAMTLHAIWTLEGFGVFTSNPAKWVPILEEPSNAST